VSGGRFFQKSFSYTHYFSIYTVMHGIMRKTYSLLAFRDIMTALHCVRGKTCSLPCMRLLFCTMSEGRRVVSSAQGMIVLLPHASEGRCGVSYTRKAGRCKVSVPNTKEMKMLVRWYWLGTYRTGYLSAWLLVGLTLVGHSCRPRHLSAWLLINLVTCRPGTCRPLL